MVRSKVCCSSCGKICNFCSLKRSAINGKLLCYNCYYRENLSRNGFSTAKIKAITNADIYSEFKKKFVTMYNTSKIKGLK